LACRTTNILLVCTFFVGLDFTTQAKINTFYCSQVHLTCEYYYYLRHQTLL
jgi:hypothetical protein